MSAFKACVADGGALMAGDSHESRPWRVKALILGAVLACLAALAVATLPAPTAPSTHPSRHGLQSRVATRLPINLAPPASATIGASERGFWPVRHGGALLTQGGGIHSTFTASGAALRMGQGTLGLSLIGVGRRGHLAPIGAVAPTGAANQIVYRHGFASESYRNGPYGLEQGYTVRQRPQTGAGSLVLALRIRGSLIPEQAGSQVLFRTQAGATALRYGQLSAIDAAGRRLPAHMQVRKGSLELRIDDSHARYPLRIDPFIQQGEKLTGGGEIGPYDFFGESVALSADGNTALIGGSGDNGGVGAAWVFTRSGSTWSQQAKLTGSGEISQGYFGGGVALSGDGNTALIGGGGDNGGVGAAWVFTRSGSTWTQQAKLTGSGELGEGYFGGEGVALSGDGNTALIGGGGDNGGVGAAWVFTRSGSTWTQQAKLTGSGEIGEGRFGRSVALSGDGNTALIGGGGNNGEEVGAVWVFTRSGSTWTQQAKLTGSGEIGAGFFGHGVALSGDGNTALIGGGDDTGGVGAAWVFTRSGSTWTQQAKLTGSGEIGEGRFGFGVALSGDGNTALIGGPYDHPTVTGFNPVGAAWVFTRTGSTWTQQGAKLTGSGGASPGYRLFGESVTLSGDGNTALIGGPEDHSPVGAAWVFTNTSARSPTVMTGAVSFVTQVSATLRATVNPNGAGLSDCHFEYGPTTSYGSSVPCSLLLASETSPVALSGSLTGLSKDTTYHFRIVATNLGGTSSGADEKFRTAKAPTQRYRVTDLGTLGGPTSEASAINKSGQVTGAADLARTGVVHAFRWSHGVMTDLGGLVGTDHGCACTFGNAINDAGDVAGSGVTNSGDGVATLWKGTTMSVIAHYPDQALGINNAGDVVGGTFYWPVCDPFLGNWLYQNGAVTHIGFGTEDGGQADDIDNRGQVVGAACVNARGNAPYHAYVWNSGAITDLGTLGGKNSEATAISDSGKIVGFSQVSDDVAEHAFRRSHGSLEDLGTLGGTNSRALAVNDKGQIVGYSDVATGGPHAFLYSARSIEDLNNYIPASSGWVLERATGINKRGEIVGTGTHNGVKRAFLLTR